MLKTIRTFWRDATVRIPRDEGLVHQDQIRNIIKRQARGNVSAKQGQILTAAEVKARKAALAKVDF